MSSARWMTRAICDLCWQDWQPGREPYRFREDLRQIEICCWCGAPTSSGIYAREDQNVLQLCVGSHE